MIRFLDSSALVKRYAPERGSDELDRAFLEMDRVAIHVPWIAVLEVFSVLIRRRNDGRMSARRFEEAARVFQAEVVLQRAVRIVATSPDSILSALERIAGHGINASDAIILDSARIALEAEDGEFWTADKRLARAARAEGLSIRTPGGDLGP